MGVLIATAATRALLTEGEQHKRDRMMPNADELIRTYVPDAEFYTEPEAYRVALARDEAVALQLEAQCQASQP